MNTHIPIDAWLICGHSHEIVPGQYEIYSIIICNLYCRVQIASVKIENVFLVISKKRSIYFYDRFANFMENTFGLRIFEDI